MKLAHRLSIGYILLALLLNGCSSANSSLSAQDKSGNDSTEKLRFADIPVNQDLFTNETVMPLPMPPEIFFLTAEQQREFLEFYYDEARQHLLPDRRLASFVERRYTDFNYYGKTLKATNSLQGETGNCLSLAILTTAYARLIDVSVDYQLVYSVPIYELIDDTLYVSSHIRSRVSSPSEHNRETGQISYSHSFIDYFPSARRQRGQYISEQHFISMFYQNVAAELLKQNDDEAAFPYLMKALQIAPDNVAALNALAVLHRRKQDVITAEKLYRFILDYYPVNLNAMINFREMLTLQGRYKEAHALNETISHINDPNPYEWIFLADEAIQHGQLARAERYLERAQHLAPYLDEIYFRYAHIDYQRGRITSAQHHLSTAHQFARTVDRRQLYKAKLGVLHAAE
ncbi:hypothetical protein SAMN04488051_10634 [Alkalimonas amylolytica]|uniref:Uncharacterized protein n=2 Tax=Alkalimonas amylolytica TaxID=152573 RepID=A0A1H4DVA5_ALKAM|nr:hypothetical protein SAMN04488051_10634 [Alkalimonas amylolytica]